jgi:hypothetical protein
MVRWTGGGPHALVKVIQSADQSLHTQGVTIVERVIETALANQRQALEDATTPTGEARMSDPASNAPAGATAGRHLTGEMIEATSAEIEVHADKIIGTWGWADPEVYYAAQEHGLGHVPAAGSLFTSFVQAEQDFAREVRDIEGGF